MPDSTRQSASFKISVQSKDVAPEDKPGTSVPSTTAAGNGTQAWQVLAINGEAMAQCSVREVITETTRSTIGVAIGPHLFRTAAGVE
jgi:hypothetical protein